MHNRKIIILFAAFSWTLRGHLANDEKHECPQPVSIRNGFIIKTRLKITCCPDYYLYEGRCRECQAGMFGKDCKFRCLPGYYGVQCHEMCHCHEHTKCDPVHGCICDDDWTGINCNDHCEPGTHGKDCLYKCKQGFYGDLCKMRCNCSENSICDRVKGCICHDGWTGVNCSEACPDGKFGENCSQNCQCFNGGICNPASGECICPSNWIGVNCTDYHKKTNDPGMQRNIQMILIVLVSVFGCLIFVVFVLGLVIYIRRLNKRKNNLNLSEHHEVHHLYDEIDPGQELDETNVSTNEVRPHISLPGVHVREEHLQATNIINTTSSINAHDGTYLNPYNTLQEYESGRLYEQIKLINRSYSLEYICRKPIGNIGNTRRNTN